MIRLGIDMKKGKMLHRKLTIRLAIILVAGLTGAGAAALDVEYVGSIVEGLHSPTSVVAGEEFVAVLDPYAGNLSLFSPDGPVVRKIHLQGAAHSLTRIAFQTYAFCDRARKTVAAYDFAADRQFDYLDMQTGLIDPVDLVLDGSSLHVLDAGNSAIVIFDENRIPIDIISLKDETGTNLRFASSFAYDAGGKSYYVFDQTNSRICRFDIEGKYLGSLASFGSGEGRITRGGDIELTSYGQILVTDRYQGRVGIFGSDGDFLGFFGAHQNDRPSLSIPTGISIDENGLVYVASTMGASVAVYYLPPIVTEAELLTVMQHYPEDGAEISAKNLTLEAYIEAYQAAEQITGFEFQIYDNESAVTPLDESMLIDPDSHIDLPGGRQRVSAYWTPGFDFKEQINYRWRSRVHTVDTVGEWSALKSFYVTALPRHYRLDQNVPNPFNPETRISYTLADESDVVLEVIDLLGRKVRTLVQDRLPAGDYQVIWDGTDNEGRQTASGIYFYRIQSGEFSQSRKMVLLK